MAARRRVPHPFFLRHAWKPAYLYRWLRVEWWLQRAPALSDTEGPA